MQSCVCVPYACCVTLFAAGFDFKAGSYEGLFPANETSAVISIPIVDDLHSNEGMEYFIVHLLAHSTISDDVAVSSGNIQKATVYIQDEIVVSFLEEYVYVKEGEDLFLTVITSAISNQDFNITVNIISDNDHCEFVLIVKYVQYIYIDPDLKECMS